MKSDGTLKFTNRAGFLVTSDARSPMTGFEYSAASHFTEYMTRDEKRQSIREEMLPKRDSIPSPVRHELSRVINKQVIDFIETGAIDTVMLYLSMRSEVDTRDLLVYLLRTNRIALAPTIEARHLVPRRISNTSTQLKRHRYGMLQPDQDVCPKFPLNQIDLIIVPGIAFDLKKHRIGSGGGYYDRFLPKCPQAIWMGLAFEEQLIQDTLPQSWDVALHFIVTENCS